MQVNVHINSAINFNLARNIVPSNHQNSRTINMNMNVKKINIQEQRDDHERNNNSNDQAEEEEEETNEMEYFTPPTSQKHQPNHQH